MTNTEFLAPTRFRASFADPLLLLEAVKRLRLEGFRVIDTYSPFPVHGMDEAIGLKPSRLPRACLGFGLLGLATALGVQIWTWPTTTPSSWVASPWSPCRPLFQWPSSSRS